MTKNNKTKEACLYISKRNIFLTTQLLAIIMQASDKKKNEQKLGPFSSIVDFSCSCNE